MLKKTLAGIFLCTSSLAFTQNMDQNVIGSAGQDYVGTNANMSWTIGESVILTHSSTNAILTQGFHQAFLDFTEIRDLNSNLLVQVYPNPSRSDFTIEIGEDNNELFEATVTDLTGKVVFNDVLQMKTIISADSWASGMYILHLTNTHDQSIKTFKIQKLN